MEKPRESFSRKQKLGRGYYAELLTNLNYSDAHKKEFPGVHRKTNLIWQVNTEKHAPLLMELVPPQKKVVLAPAQRWMAFDADKDIAFPVDTFKPKVQHQHEVDPMTLPRNVAIERRRRLYQGEDIATLLERMEVKPRDLLPIHILFREITLPNERYGLSSWVPFLPLELFDDEEFTVRSPENWIEHGIIEGIRHPLPATAFVPNAEVNEDNRYLFDLRELYKWVDVAALDYHPKTKLWKVVTLDGLKRIFHLPKIFLMMKAEDPVNFANSIISAIALRKKAEDTIRCEFFMDCMSLTGIPTMSEEMLERIMSRVRNTKVGKAMYLSDYFKKLKEEIQLNHQRTIGELDFKRVQGQTDYQLFKFEKPLKPPVYKKINTDLSESEFKKKKTFFAWYNIYVVPETYLAMSYVVGECHKVAQMSLFTSSYGARYVTLDEFLTIQTQITNIKAYNLILPVRNKNPFMQLNDLHSEYARLFLVPEL